MSKSDYLQKVKQRLAEGYYRQIDTANITSIINRSKTEVGRYLWTVTNPSGRGTSEIIQRILNTVNPRVAFQRGDTLRSTLGQLKDRISVNRTRYCVYKIKCNDCIKVYIGQTSKGIHTRIGQHKRKLNRPPRNADEYRTLLKDSAIAEHALDKRHKINLENVEVLGRGLLSTSQRLVAEG
ncbi:hypothetical protein CLF_102391 [Clonorchis sinensis]|uniref:C2H2-type domain-containing protein n=1 Tax=Clonorchis sinensis TaxID=79923 RepID=G7Y7T9_CLOSI|nr:hypothetical protein CLF_102391 [Clonorchis sinensis]